MRRRSTSAFASCPLSGGRGRRAEISSKESLIAPHHWSLQKAWDAFRIAVGAPRELDRKYSIQIINIPTRLELFQILFALSKSLTSENASRSATCSLHLFFLKLGNPGIHGMRLNRIFDQRDAPRQPRNLLSATDGMASKDGERRPPLPSPRSLLSFAPRRSPSLDPLRRVP
jgi:hypothetical protein